MARGFESKDVEFQQAEAEREKAVGPELTADQRRLAERRRTTELSLARAKGDLDAAKRPAHRRMLQQAVAVLEAELAAAPER
ncbi:MAG: hypothetical protein GEU82_00445 [Luteitalea sp.]|nr:hypothetical protein [Luteitalea sp.]